MPAAWAIVVVPHVVFARPEKLHRLSANLLRDSRRFDHVVVGEPAAEPAARPLQMDRDVAFLHAERVGDKRASLRRRLRRGPDLELAVLELRGAVLRFERRVRTEGELVPALHALQTGAVERSFTVAVRAHPEDRRLLP